MSFSMIRSVLLVAGLALPLAPAMATEPASSPPVAAPPAASAETPAPPEAASAAEAKAEKATVADATADDPVVCKRVAVTGSRVKKEQVCKTKSEWEVYSQRAKEFMRGIERGGSRQPGGEGLPSGG